METHNPAYLASKTEHPDMVVLKFVQLENKFEIQLEKSGSWDDLEPGKRYNLEMIPTDLKIQEE